MSSCAAFRRGWEIGGSEEHAAACAACADWVAGQRRAMSALAHLAGDLDSSVIPGEHEAALRRAFRQAREPAAGSHAWRWAWGLVTASACALLIVVVLFRPAVREQAAPRVATARPKAPLPVAEARAADTPGLAAPSSAARVRRVERRDVRDATTPPEPTPQPKDLTSPAAATSPVELAAVPVLPLPAASAAEPDETGPAIAEAPVVAGAPTQRASVDDQGFSPLPGSETTDMDSGQIVRVQLRADVLDAAGLPPRPGTNKGPVEAEVLVGPDGVARGIRVARPRR
jgi:hypothetical protein